MRKLIYLNIPAYGHVNPTLPVVQELIRRGDQVLYYNTETFRRPIERTGATFRAYPETILTPEGISRVLQDGNLSNVSVLLLRAAEALVPFVVEELAQEAPDLLIYDATVLWGRIAARRLKLRSVASISTFILDLKSGILGRRDMLSMLGQTLPNLPRIFAPRIRLSRRYGNAFPTTRTLFPVLGDRNIVFTARELQPDTSLIDETFRFVGPSINPQTRSEDFPFERLNEGRVVYISLGTVHRSRDFIRQCFEAFRNYPAQFILSAGKETGIEALGDIPANFIVRQSVPQLAVLERADGFITHGGINSVQEGLYYGVPLLVIPQQVEQLFNARIVAAQGTGLVLDEALKGREVVAETLRQMLDQLLNEPSYRAAAVMVQKTLRASGGYPQAADEIQAFAAGSKP